VMRSPEWHPLSPQAAHQAADRSVAGLSIIDYCGRPCTVLYRVLTPLGYWVYVTHQTLAHVRKRHHRTAVTMLDNLPHILNNPDIVVPDYELCTRHLYYKVYRGRLYAVPVPERDEVRYVATMHRTEYIKGLKRGFIAARDILYLRGGFRWHKWK
jgi:hypothetical protein